MSGNSETRVQALQREIKRLTERNHLLAAQVRKQFRELARQRALLEECSDLMDEAQADSEESDFGEAARYESDNDSIEADDLDDM